MDGGDERAERLAQIEVIYRTRLRELLRVAAAISESREGAPDLVQEAFVRAVQGVDGFRGEGPLEGWLWRIVVNVARNGRRAPRTVAFPEEPPVAGSAPADVAGSELVAAMSRLSEREQLVLFLRYYADLDYRTIAEALEISGGTVGATLTHARAGLAQALEVKEATP